MKNALFLIRGLPGSGKSTLADNIVADLMATDNQNQIAIKIEADQFFLSSNGHKEVYEFDRRFLGAAHDECYGRTMRYLKAGYNVAVANTFSTQRELSRYTSGLVRCGLENKVIVKIITCTGDYGSIHNVPTRAIEKMRERWEYVPDEVYFNGELK